MARHAFHFFRSGGVDQVSLRGGDDLLALDQLDQQLWVALAMPVKGIDVDPLTLALLDRDGDGRIRARDILAAIAWAKTTLRDPSSLLSSKPAVELAAIADAKVAAGARRVLADLGRDAATAVSVDDIVAVDKAFVETVLNGDGVVIEASTPDLALRAVIADAIACVGAVADRSGKPGIDQAGAGKLFAEVDRRHGWLVAERDALPLGDRTEAAAAAFVTVRGKLDDYFTRCRIAAYDPRALDLLASSEAELAALTPRSLAATDDALAALPLARLELAGRLGLGAGINPAWRARIDAFRAAAVEPILGARDAVTEADVAAIAAALAPHLAWRDARPTTVVDALAAPRIAELAAPEPRVQLAALIAADAALADEYAQITAIGKLVRMQRDFGRVLRNFVNFSDFYSHQDGAFQTGTLYLDARALHLCIPVDDAAKHGTLAAQSDACLLYCDLVRLGQTRQIAAALTDGDIDNVFVGRNGVFYDRAGNDWDATVTKIVVNPISIRAAFWSPYKKLVKTIEDTVAKRAQAAEARSSSAMAAAGTEVGHADDLGAAPPVAPPSVPTKIDLGTVAAIGVAIGGIGTLVGALLATLFGLGAWLPVGVVALMLLISGPSMLLAWLKLRRRNLGPILDANGWAINGRARINVAFGAAMTTMPKLPPGAVRSLDDPFADKRTPWRRWVFLAVVVGLAGSWYVGRLDRYLPEAATSVHVLGIHAPGYVEPK